MTELAGAFLAVVVLGSFVLIPRVRAAAERRARIVIALAESLKATVDDDYFRDSAIEAWVQTNPRAAGLRLAAGSKALLSRPIRAEYDAAAVLLKDPRGWARRHNDRFVEEKLRDLSNWFENRLPHPLTASQRQAVIIDEDTNLVVAGAGAGKTSTILAKVAYLLEERGESPDSILVLAFNRSVAKELGQRIGSMDLPRPEISTFHAKGFDVLGAAWGRKPAVSALSTDDKALQALLQSEFESMLANNRRRRRFARWWVRFRVSLDDLEDCKTPDERLRKEQSLGVRTLTGVKVASMAEVKVADWLTLNGVPWEHEKRYPHSPPSSTRRDYTPDFYLPAHDVWLEVWACDRAEDDFPPQIDREQYVASMKWKRELHQGHGTKLVEIFQDDVWGPRLGARIRQGLGRVGTQPDALSDQLVPDLIAAVRGNIAPFVMLVSTFLRLYRAGGWTRREVESRAPTVRDRAFLKLFWPFLSRYEHELETEDKIDFDAMLIEAASAANEGRYERRYRYILVDEFQDTSRARMRLVQALRRARSECRVFAVGDDWQSIYRFAGSDIAYFTAIEDHLGPTARTFLPDTFRLRADVAAVSSRFVLENSAQLEKELQPQTQSSGRGVTIRLHGPEREAEAVHEVLSEIAESLPGGRVLVLARYKHRLSLIQDLAVPPDLQLEARTVHSAKGLEADAVIVLGVDAGLFGFPTEIQDDRVLRLLLEREESFPNAEERRLFYVALTRTRSQVYLLAEQRTTSPFIEELEKDLYAPWISLHGTESDRHQCPRCHGKTVVRRSGPYGAFWACTHYPACHGRLPKCPACSEGALRLPTGRSTSEAVRCTACDYETTVCPRCGSGVLVEREGRFGRFLGCNTWRGNGSGCDYTSNLETQLGSEQKSR